MPVELTTVADDAATFHDGTTSTSWTGSSRTPSTSTTAIRSARSPVRRPLRCRIGTVNDVHFGEVEAGRIDDHPTARSAVAPGAPPYPETMNRAAVAEMAAADLAAVIVKGDLTDDGTAEEFAAFEACYRRPFGDRLHVVRGNHDAYRGQTEYAGDQWIELPGVAVALLDTTIPTQHRAPHRRAARLARRRRRGVDGAGARDGPPPAVGVGRRAAWSTSASTPMPATP